jgi:vancomycin permeability regulator SanA
VSPPRDVLVVFGATVRPDGGPSAALLRRVVTAARYGRPAVFLVTGAGPHPTVNEAALMARLLREQGIAAGDIIEENAAQSTRQSVLLCRPILRRLPAGGRIVVCSDGFHVPRCRWLFRLAGVRTSAHAAPPESLQLGWRLREFAAIIVDTIAMLARSRTITRA